MMKKLNKKGFTLVELLAVIVVLAIIIVIAVPAVLDSVDKAKLNSFRVYAKRMINAAMTKREADSVLGTSAATCWKIGDLAGAESGKYFGQVKYESGDYKIYMTDGTHYIQGKTLSEIDTAANVTTDAPSSPVGFTKTSNVFADANC